MRIAVLGGSFNPPHVGHALICAWLHWTDQCDEVWLLPVHVHAFGKEVEPFERRASWCRAMASQIGGFVRVCEVESEREETSYTADTLDLLSERHPEARFRLVVGADALPTFHKWHRFEELQSQYDPLVVGRPGYPPVPGMPTFPEISSTDIRARIARGEDVSTLVPSSVMALLGDAYRPH